METFDDLQGPVRTAVIDEQDLQLIGLVMQDFLHGLIEQRDGLFFVKDRNDQGKQFHLLSPCMSPPYSARAQGQTTIRSRCPMTEGLLYAPVYR